MMTIVLVATLLAAVLAGIIYWRFGNPFTWGKDDDDLDMVPVASLPGRSPNPDRSPTAARLAPALAESPSISWPHPTLLEGFSRQATENGAQLVGDYAVACENGLYVRVLTVDQPSGYVLLFDSVHSGPWKEVLLHYADGSTYTASTLPEPLADLPRPDEDALEWFERHTGVDELLAVADDNAGEQVVLPASPEQFERRFVALTRRLREARRRPDAA